MIPFAPTGGDDTVALQAAINGTLSLEILAGDSKISDTITVPAGCEIIFRKGARLLADHPTKNIISLGSETRLVGARIEPAQPRTYGAYIRIPSSSIRVKLEDTFLLGAQWGIETDGTIFDIDTLEIRETNPGGIGIIVNQGFDQSIRHMVMDSTPGAAGPAAGIWVNATGDLLLHDVNIMHAGYCLALCPGSGQVIGNLRVSDSCMDSSSVGFLASPAALGHVIYVRLTNVWCGNHQYNAALIAGTGAIDGIEFVACDLVQSGTNGITKTNAGATHISRIGGLP